MIAGPGIALGQALARTASERSVPIPVFADMSSINPVFLCPDALSATPEALADAFAASLTLGAGQLCTNPGPVIAVRGHALDGFIARAGKALAGSPSATMLTPGIHAACQRGVEERGRAEGVSQVAAGLLGEGENQCRAALFVTKKIRF